MVCLSVCLLVTFGNPAKTAEPIKMTFGVRGLSRVHQRNYVLDGVWFSKGKRHCSGLSAQSKIIGSLRWDVRKKTAEPIEMPFWALTHKEPFVRWGHDRTNSFAAARSDKMMRPFVKIL